MQPEPDIVFHGLPTTVRSALMKKTLKLHQVARLLDAFFAFGGSEGEVFTRDMALEVGEHIKMGKNTVNKVLNTTLPLENGEALLIFERVEILCEETRIFTPKFQVNYLTLE